MKLNFQNTRYASRDTRYEFEKPSTSVESALQISSFMQNKPNFGNDKMSVSIDMTSNYIDFANRSHEKTKPIQTQFKPKQTQFKPKTNPIFLPFAACKKRNFCV